MTTEQVSEVSAQQSTPQDPGAGSDTSSQNIDTQNTSKPSGLDALKQTVNDRLLPNNADLASKPTGNPYAPNFKFKAMDKMHEIEDWARPFIKDEVTEKAFRKLHEKAYALEDLRAQKESFRTQVEQMQPQVQEMAGQLQTFNALKQQGDYDNLFKFLGIGNEQILNHAQRILDVMKMSPEQRQDFDQQNQIREQAFQYQNQNQQLQQMFQQQAVQTRTLELNYVLDKPENKKVAEAWDSKMGTPGAFVDLVKREAFNNVQLTGTDWTAEQAVQHAVNNFGKILTFEQANAQGQVAQPGAQTSATQGQQQAPIIPHVAGKGGSPLKKKPKSIADLKALAKSMQE